MKETGKGAEIDRNKEKDESSPKEMANEMPNQIVFG